jgi:hypothetical protein
MDLGSVPGELHLIHQLIDQKDSTAMIGVNIFSDDWVWDALRIETGAGVSNHNQNAPLLVASDIAFHRFVGISLRSVYNGIGQGFGQSQLDGVFFSFNAFLVADYTHDALYHRIDSISVRRQRNAKF